MGTGDVLVGITGGFMARKDDVITAVAAGAYLHARIGDLLYNEKGYHVIASDVVDYIPKILKGFDRTIV
jgi:NAD(P)H-hydrate epimerase